MEELKLEGSLMELVCRTCLKDSEVKFNIFEQFQKNKLISDLIMEFIPIKLQKDDGYPVNICNNCIQDLVSTCNFITMVVEADVKLKLFYKNNIRGPPPLNENSPSIKNEETGSIHSSTTFSITENSNLINHDKYSSNNVENSNQLDGQNILTERENVIEPSYFSNIEDESIVLAPENSDESSEAFPKDETNEYTNNFSIKSDNQLAQGDVNNTKEKCDEICEEQSTKQFEGDSSNVIMKCEEAESEVATSTHKISPHKSFSRIKPCDKCNSDGKLKVNELDKLKVNQLDKLKIKPLDKKRKYFTKKNVNEKQAELLDNPDFKRIMELNLSKKEKRQQTIFCKECNKTFTFAYFLGTHVHFHTGNLPFKCDKCSTYYPKRSMLNQHLRKHDTARNFSCEECGKAFRNIHILKQHKKVHSGEKPYKCHICGKGLKHALSLSLHIKIHKNEKNHICEVCGKAFVDYNILRVHIMRHTVSEKNFECTICKKKFALKKDLDNHGQTHSDKRPYICNECGKSFSSKEVMRKHFLIHTGEKPYVCNVCGKRFRQSGSIGRHMRVHTGETPFPCNLCDSAFKYKHHLQNHMKVHQK